MISVKLSKRLDKIASYVEKDSILADIGCDHALLDIYLEKNKIVKKAYACDVNSNALNQAKKNILLYNANNVDTILSDGFKNISSSYNINTVVISGLGNSKIISILKNDNSLLKKIDTLIIQSNTNVYDVRKNVVKLGYYIESECMVKERDIIYQIIKFKKGYRYYSDRQLYFGPILLKNKDNLFKEYFTNEINSNYNILKKLPNKEIIKRIKIKYLIFKLKKEIHY